MIVLLIYALAGISLLMVDKYYRKAYAGDVSTWLEDLLIVLLWPLVTILYAISYFNLVRKD